MSTALFDPYRRQQAMLWHNRLAHWRANPGETVFHALAALAIAAVLLMPITTAWPHASAMRDLAARWPMATLLTLTALMAWRQLQVIDAQHANRRSDWLALQPLSPALYRQRLRRRQAVEVISQVLLLALLMLAAHAPWWWLAVGAAAAVVACVLATLLRRVRGSMAAASRPRLHSAIVDAGAGRFWRWQLIETGIAFRGRSLAGGLLILLLIPMGSSALAIVLCGVAGLVIAWLMTAWNRALAVLPAAHAWLASQPLRGTCLLRATCAVPLLIVACAGALVAGVFALLGSGQQGLVAAAGLVAVGLLQFACVMAERARPRRIAMVFSVHVAALVAVLQAMPLLLPVVWLGQMVWLLKRGVRA